MKTTLTFKTPDVIDNAIQGLTEEKAKIGKQIETKFVEYNEYRMLNLTPVPKLAQYYLFKRTK